MTQFIFKNDFEITEVIETAGYRNDVRLCTTDDEDYPWAIMTTDYYTRHNKTKLYESEEAAREVFNKFKS